MTQSARVALDTAGQYLFAMNRAGQISWATPQAHHLFALSGYSADWLQQDLPRQLGQLLHPDFNREKGVILRDGDKPLEVRYISQHDDDEYLLRLIDPDRPSETESLRQAVPVTEREAEVLLWIARGKTNREIGTILSLSPRTDNKHLEQVYRKLGVENRTSAAAMALKVLI